MTATDDPVTKGKPGRKPRFSREELERRTRKAALDAVLRSGVTAGVDAIRIERVIIEADVPRAATYELWDAHGEGSSQENLRRAIVTQIIEELPSSNVEPTRELALRLTADNADRVKSNDPDELQKLRAELIREVGAFNHDILHSQRWRVYETLTSSISTQEDTELREAAARGQEVLLASYIEFFAEVATLFKLRLRPGFSMVHFCMSAYALNEGLANRVGPSFQDQTVMRDGEEWTVFSIGFEALVAQYFEDDF